MGGGYDGAGGAGEAMNLELAATEWLANHKKCMIVLRELSPRTTYCGEPDAYGVTRARYSIEVEIKRSLSDFYRDKAKPSRKSREYYPHHFPKYFYYLLPEEISDKARSSLPEWAGLLSCGQHGVISVLVESPRNKESKRLSIKECAKLSCQMSVYASRIDSRLDGAFTAWKNGCEPYYWNYQI